MRWRGEQYLGTCTHSAERNPGALQILIISSMQCTPLASIWSSTCCAGSSTAPAAAALTSDNTRSTTRRWLRTSFPVKYDESSVADENSSSNLLPTGIRSRLRLPPLLHVGWATSAGPVDVTSTPT